MGMFDNFGSQLIRGPNPFSQDPNGIGSILTDPMDLFGKRARDTRDEVARILKQSASENIAMQEAQNQKIRELYQPYRDLALAPGGALSNLSAMTTGQGEINYQPSELYKFQAETGTRNIDRGSAAKGNYLSSNRLEKLSGLYGGLAAEEAQRLYGANLTGVQLGSGATDAVMNAGQSLAGNVSAINSNLGQGINTTYQNYGQNRAAAIGGAANSLSGLSQYWATKGK